MSSFYFNLIGIIVPILYTHETSWKHDQSLSLVWFQWKPSGSLENEVFRCEFYESIRIYDRHSVQMLWKRTAIIPDRRLLFSYLLKQRIHRHVPYIHITHLWSSAVFYAAGYCIMCDHHELKLLVAVVGAVTRSCCCHRRHCCRLHWRCTTRQ